MSFMHNLFGPLINNLQSLVEHGGYSILFIITILEGIPLIGPLIPGHTAVILSGFLIKLGIMNWIVVTVLVVVGAMLGDLVGYYLGKKYGFVFLEKFGKYIFIKKEHIEKARAIVAKHTGKAIIFGRFSPITRPLAPFIVGASNVHIRSFWFYDFVGVFIWSVSSIALGYIFGASYHVAAGIFGKFVVIAIILSILIIWGYRVINRQFHIFAKYELIVLILNICGLYLFFKTVQDALKDRAFLANIDVWINGFFNTHTTNVGLFIMEWVSKILSPEFLSILAFVGIIYFLKNKQWRYSIIAGLSIVGGLGIGGFIKEMVARPRPEFSLITESGYSFPSGHAIIVTIFFTLVIYFFARKFKSLHKRELFMTVSVLLILLTAVSRLYLGVHWFSDVIAGIGFGLFWATGMILLVRYFGVIVKVLREKVV